MRSRLYLEKLPVIEVVVYAVLNGNVSQLVDTSKLDLHSDFYVIWNILGEAENTGIDDIMNQLFVVQIATVANHWTEKSDHGVDLQVKVSIIVVDQYYVVIKSNIYCLIEKIANGSYFSRRSVYLLVLVDVSIAEAHLFTTF